MDMYINNERVVRVLKEGKMSNGLKLTIVETEYEFGRHYVLLMSGRAGFHSTDYDRVERYMNDYLKY